MSPFNPITQSINYNESTAIRSMLVMGQVMSAILLELLISIWTMAPELALLMGSASIRSWVSVLDLRWRCCLCFYVPRVMGLWAFNHNTN